jgi:hypothetical protein
MNEYDPAARYAAKLDPPAFLSWLLAGLDPDLQFARWLDTQTIPFPGEPDRRCDTVAELVSASGTQPPWALVSEFQSRPDPDIGYRLLEYQGRLGLALLFSELAGRQEVWTKLLEDWNMEESQIVAGWVAKGEKRGEQRGEERGKIEGRREMLRANLIQALELRAASPLPTDLLTLITGENDETRLSNWFKAALTCASLEDFQKGLKPASPADTTTNGA